MGAVRAKGRMGGVSAGVCRGRNRQTGAKRRQKTQRSGRRNGRRRRRRRAGGAEEGGEQRRTGGGEQGSREEQRGWGRLSGEQGRRRRTRREAAENDKDDEDEEQEQGERDEKEELDEEAPRTRGRRKGLRGQRRQLLLARSGAPARPDGTTLCEVEAKRPTNVDAEACRRRADRTGVRHGLDVNTHPSGCHGRSKNEPRIRPRGRHLLRAKPTLCAATAPADD